MLGSGAVQIPWKHSQAEFVLYCADYTQLDHKYNNDNIVTFS